jgi:hypothetical protein
MFHLMPHRELPDDFQDMYDPVWVRPPWPVLADPVRVGQYYNWTLDALIYAAEQGFDRICVIPGVPTEVLPNAGHVPQLERLDAAGPMVTQFLRS